MSHVGLFCTQAFKRGSNTDLFRVIWPLEMEAIYLFWEGNEDPPEAVIWLTDSSSQCLSLHPTRRHSVKAIQFMWGEHTQWVRWEKCTQPQRDKKQGEDKRQYRWREKSSQDLKFCSTCCSVLRQEVSDLRPRADFVSPWHVHILETNIFQEEPKQTRYGVTDLSKLYRRKKKIQR